MKYERFSPERGEDDDPRDVIFVCVDDLEIDPLVQRALQLTSPVWKSKWDWDRAEVVTVADRDGKLFVVEGQNRVEKRKAEAPGSKMLAVLIGGGRNNEAAAALGINKGRRKHKAMDNWKLAAESGSEYELLAEEVLAEAGLSLTGSTRPGRTVINAVGTVALIIRSNGKTPQQGAALLELIIKVITAAYGPGEEGRFDPAVIRGVADIIETNMGRVRLDRLILTLQKEQAAKWIRLAKDAAALRNERNTWQYLSREVIARYNKGLQKDGPNVLAWSRDVR